MYKVQLSTNKDSIWVKLQESWVFVIVSLPLQEDFGYLTYQTPQTIHKSTTPNLEVEAYNKLTHHFVSTIRGIINLLKSTLGIEPNTFHK